MAKKSQAVLDQTTKSRSDALFSYTAITPAMIILFGFTLIPFIMSVVKSFEGRNGFTLEHYARLGEDEIFHQVVFNNAVFTLVTVPATIAVSLGMAMLVIKAVRGSSLLRTAVLSPTILPVVAAGSVWLYIYQPSFGLLNSILRFFGFEGQNWLGDTSLAMPSLIVVHVWQQAGLFVLFYMSALLGMDTQMKEAADIEGAGSWYFFRRVTWPTLMPTTLFVAVMAIANSFKQIDLVFVLTQGGPDNTTNLLLYYIWRTAFGQFRDDYAAAITVILVIILLIVAVVQVRLMDKRIHYR